MIELRWLLRQVPRIRGIDDGFYNPVLPDFLAVPVLQYREGSYPYEAPYEDTWAGSDWTDVPTVAETAEPLSDLPLPHPDKP